VAGQGQQEEDEAAEENPRQERAQPGRDLRHGLGGCTKAGHGGISFNRWSILDCRQNVPPGSVGRYDQDHKTRSTLGEALGAVTGITLRGNV
jgi:hypothetical protein